MKKCFFGAIAVLALASCSNEKVVELSQDQEIKLTAVTGKALSRAEHAYCNNDMPGDFQVWANVPTNKVYFSGDKFVKQGDTQTYKNDGDARYWPNGKINLFACKNATPEWNGDNSNLVVEGFQVNGDVAKQVDFIYARKDVTSKPASTSPAVEINFRHALSQVEFQARNENKKIHVEVKGVSVCRVADTNTFTFPTATTTPNHESTGEDDAHTTRPSGSISNQGTWGAPTGTANYTVTLGTAVSVKSTTTGITIPAKEWDTNTMILMPQTITAWDKTVDTGSAKPAGSGSYLLLNCKIWNIAGSQFDSTTDVLLWPKTDGEHADIAIPFSGTWEQGKRYIYTFVFTSKGNGGIDPGTGDEVLTPIQLNVTVDDFFEGGNTDVPMVK